MPQKKVGLVENQLWQILLLIMRNPWALLHKSKNRQNFQMNGPKISANTAKRAHHSSDRAPCPPASFKILENSWAGGLNALCTLKKLGEGKRSKNSCPWGKSWSTDLISANFVIFYNFVSTSGASLSPKCTALARPSWMSCRLTLAGRLPRLTLRCAKAMLDMKARAVKCIAAGGGHFE